MRFDRGSIAGWLVLVCLVGLLGWAGVQALLGKGAQRAQTPTSQAASTSVSSATAAIATAANPESALSHPDVSFKLPGALAEISGLSASGDPKALWAVNDEQGKVFRLSTVNGEVLDELTFGEAADYEAIEDIEGVLYVGRSDGMIFLVDPTSQKAEELDARDVLGKTCDLEGLGYQREHLRLLMACKGAQAASGGFPIYALDVLTRTVQPEPAYVITVKALETYFASHTDAPGLKRLKANAFSPSSVAVHPTTGNVFVLSSTGEMLVQLDRKGTVVQIQPLDRELHPQPEGLTFTEDGALFISNESRGKPALIHKYGKGAGQPSQL